MSSSKVELTCTFCSKPQSEVSQLVAAEDNKTFICNDCVESCRTEILSFKKMASDEPIELKKEAGIPKPREIKEHLDRYIIGQDNAKEAISVAVYNHYKRLAAAKSPDVDVELEKSNILLVGPTGSGKTLFARTIAKLLDVPFAIADATSLTEAGYVGDDVESIITRLLQAADYDIEKAQRGIIYLDEIDKKARKGDTASGAKDVSGEGVQQALLKLLEGSEVFVTGNGGRKNPSHEMHKVDTTNILFICGGAFVGIEEVIRKSHKKGSSIGFSAVHAPVNAETNRDLLAKIEPEHIATFGLIPELVGRLPVIAALDELDEAQLIRVLTEPRNAISKQFSSLFGMDDVSLEFEDAALTELARLSVSKKTGARGLRGVLEKKLMRLQFDLPDLRADGVSKIIITKDMISSGAKPIMIYGGQNK